MSVLAPITYGHADDLRDYLSALPSDAGSPFQAVPQTHFARFLVLDAFDAVPAHSHRVGPLMEEFLLFSTYFSGRPSGYLEALRLRMGSVADDIWGHCIGYPGQWDRRGFHAYLRHNQVPAQLFYSAYSATADEIRSALAVREEHGRFAAARPLKRDNATLQREFLQAFEPRRFSS
jgi:hypothetical protein